MFIAALFVISKNWGKKTPQKVIFKQLWHFATMEYDSAVKSNELLIHNAERSLSKRSTLYHSIYKAFQNDTITETENRCVVSGARMLCGCERGGYDYRSSRREEQPAPPLWWRLQESAQVIK